MNDTTIFLAQILGPIYVVVALSLFMSKERYAKMIDQLEAQYTSSYFYAITAMAVGLAIILKHNMWTSLATVLVSLIGWIALIKGVVYLLFPKHMIATAKSLQNNIAGLAIVPLALGVYLSWVGDF